MTKPPTPFEAADEDMRRNGATHDYVTGRQLTAEDRAFLALPLEERREIIRRDVEMAKAKQGCALYVAIIVGSLFATIASVMMLVA